jgi:DNA-binding response OmpR family regulator
MSIRHSIHRPRLIAIIDAYDERDMYAEAFRREGYLVTTARTAGEGLALVSEDSPDVVIHGVALPDMHGAELARRLRTAVIRTIRVVAITGFTDNSTVRSLRDAGCDAIVQKPCLPEDLIAQVRRVLRLVPTSRNSVHHMH